MEIGEKIYKIAEAIFPIYRSITGNGVRETLNVLKSYVSDLQIHEVPSGQKVFDWEVPEEWNIKEAYIEYIHENGKKEKILDFKENGLHVLGYSTPIDKYVDRSELLQYVYVQEGQSRAIPYVTSYYKKRCGFCMSEEQRDKLKEGLYHICIDSEYSDGSMTYGEIYFPGSTKDEILFSTYVCHPTMANNECSGPSLAIALAEYIKSLPKHKYSYRFLFVPETIGSITYLSKYIDELKKYVKAGFVLSCVGDDRTYSYIETRYGNTMADFVLQNVLSSYYPEYKRYSYLKRGSDERQYNAPGVDLPICGFCRSKYGEYPEYHTSLDDMDLVSAKGFQGSYDVMEQCIEVLENNEKYMVQCFCEPQLGKRNLYPTISIKGAYGETKSMLDLIAYADGTNDLIQISEKIQVPAKDLIPIIKKLIENKILDISEI